VKSKILYYYHSSYPQTEADRIFEDVHAALDQWGQQSLAQIQEFFKRKPDEQTALRLDICDTCAQIGGVTVYALLAMSAYQNSEPKFVCYFGPKEIIKKEYERICNHVRGEANKIKATLSMVKQQCEDPTWDH